MRILLDTNVLVAAFVSRGTCHEVLQHCVSLHTLLTSDFIMDELRSALIEKAGYLASEAEETVLAVREKAKVVLPAPLESDSCRDPADVFVLGAAVAGDCDCLVTGDKDLLVLRKFRGIPILSPGEFWSFEAQRGP